MSRRLGCRTGAHPNPPPALPRARTASVANWMILVLLSAGSTTPAATLSRMLPSIRSRPIWEGWAGVGRSGERGRIREAAGRKATAAAEPAAAAAAAQQARRSTGSSLASSHTLHPPCTAAPAPAWSAQCSGAPAAWPPAQWRPAEVVQWAVDSRAFSACRLPLHANAGGYRRSVLPA